jgi:hypothetical protein
MIANTVSRIIARVSRWSLTGNASARPDWPPAPPISTGTSLKYRDSTAHPKPISQSDALDHTITAPHRSLSNRSATAKSP